MSTSVAEQVERNDELSMELLKAVNSQLATLEHSDTATRERDRIKDVVNRLADQVFVAGRVDVSNTSCRLFLQMIFLYFCLSYIFSLLQFIL